MADSTEEGEGTRRANSSNREGCPDTPPNGPESDTETDDALSSTNRLLEICSEIGHKLNQICRLNRGEPQQEDPGSDDSLLIDDSILVEIHDLVDGLKDMNESLRYLEKSYIKLATRSHQVTEDIDSLKERLIRMKRPKSDSDQETSS